MHIGLAEHKDVSFIVKLLNETTQKLLSHKIMQWEYPWDSGLIKDDISYGYQYIVKEDNKIIAVFSLKDMSVNFWTNENNNNQLYLYRIAVAPLVQGKNIGKNICNWVQSVSKQNYKTIYLDCWAGNVKLKNFYQSVGFEYLDDFQEEDYFVSVFKYG